VSTTLGRLYVAESSAAYAKRPRIVADASVIVALLFDERDQAQALSYLSGRVIAAPYLLDLEFANAALKKLRRESLEPQKVAAALELFEELITERYAVPASAAFDLATRYSLTPYDAAYLWLAEHVEAPLVTFDARLAAAASLHLETHASDGAKPRIIGEQGIDAEG
jgi:predicted nucleic acid-binding protein